MMNVVTKDIEYKHSPPVGSSHPSAELAINRILSDSKSYLSFWQLISSPFSSGRLTAGQWLTANFILILAAGVVVAILLAVTEVAGLNVAKACAAVAVIVFTLYELNYAAMRLHDMGLEGKWSLLLLLRLVGFGVLYSGYASIYQGIEGVLAVQLPLLLGFSLMLLLAVSPGQNHRNEFGPRSSW